MLVPKIPAPITTTSAVSTRLLLPRAGLVATKLVPHADPGLVPVASFEALDESQARLLGDPDGGKVLGARVRTNDVGPERIEGVGDERADRLGGVSTTLERRRDRVPDLDHARLILRWSKADVTDQSAALALIDR